MSNSLTLQKGKAPLYFYYQVKTYEEKWKSKPFGEDTEKFLLASHIRYRSALLVDRVVDETWTPEEVLESRYVGDLYFDWDCEELEGAITGVKEFAEKLQDKGVDLTQLRWFASGGRGFHVEIPAPIFIAATPYAPRQHLPLIYKQMAMALSTQYMDMRIYTAKRGRMWRVVNVARENHKFKVPVTPDEIKKMTPELYAELVAQPRYLTLEDFSEEGTVVAPSTNLSLNPSMQSLFQRCVEKVEKAAKARKKRSDKPNALEVWGGETPPTIEQMCNGIGFKEGAGFQSIATQLAIIAHEMKWSLEDFLFKCEGLCQNHQGDSKRYGSEKLRRDELRRMWQYMEGDFTYSFTKAPITALLNHPARDLDGIAGEQVRERVEQEIERAQAGEEIARGHDPAAYLVYTSTGLKAIRDDREESITDVVFKEPKRIIDLNTGDDQGLKVTAVVSKPGYRKEKPLMLSSSVFIRKPDMQAICFEMGGYFIGSEKDLQMLRLKLADQAVKDQSLTYTVFREGLDFLSVPSSESQKLRAGFPAWVDPQSVRVTQDISDEGANFEYFNKADPSGFFSSDLMQAPAWKELATSEVREVVLAWLKSNRPETIAPLIGWFCASHYRMFFAQRPEANFPLLHIAGQAGSAKSASTALNLRLHYYQVEHKMYNPSSTQYAVTTASTRSASIPLVIDEYKPTRMNPQKLEDLRSLFRSAYNATSRQSGGGNSYSSDVRAIQKDRLSAPIVFIAEQVEQETALVERSVLVSMTRPPASVREVYRNRYRLVSDQSWVLSAIGKRIVEKAISGGLDEFKSRFSVCDENSQKKFREFTDALSIPVDASDRVPFAHAVTVFGLEVLREVVRENFANDEKLEEVFEDLIQASSGWWRLITATVQAEIEKWLTDVALLSNRPGSTLQSGKAYAYSELDGRRVIELDLYICLEEYLGHTRFAGKERLYDKLPALVHSITNHEVSFVCTGGQVLDGPHTVTLDSDALLRVGVPHFRGGSS